MAIFRHLKSCHEKDGISLFAAVPNLSTGPPGVKLQEKRFCLILQETDLERITLKYGQLSFTG